MTISDTAALLLGPDAEQVLTALLAPAGLRVGSWHVHLVHARPGAETSVGYAVSVEPTGEQEYLVVTTADVAPGPGIAHLAASTGERLAAWSHPDDPALPALRTACTADTLAGVLRTAGDTATRVDAVAVAGYRPLRRAVVEATTDAGRRWVKVLRPPAAEGLVQRLALLRAGGVAVPATVAHAPGLVVLGPAAGRSLADHLHAEGRGLPTALPTADDLLALLDRFDALPAAAHALSERAPWTARLDDYAAALVATLPDLADDVAATVADVRRALRTSDPGPRTVTHGDLHVANLWWDPAAGRRGAGRLGVIDVDTLGPGHRVDDLACLVAHLTVLPTLDPGYRTVPGRRDAWLAAFDRVVDPAGLRARAAAVLLSLAASRPGEHLARAWVDLARDLVHHHRTHGRREPATVERRAS